MMRCYFKSAVDKLYVFMDISQEVSSAFEFLQVTHESKISLNFLKSEKCQQSYVYSQWSLRFWSRVLGEIQEGPIVEHKVETKRIHT